MTQRQWQPIPTPDRGGTLQGAAGKELESGPATAGRQTVPQGSRAPGEPAGFQPQRRKGRADVRVPAPAADVRAPAPPC